MFNLTPESGVTKYNINNPFCSTNKNNVSIESLRDFGWRGTAEEADEFYIAFKEIIDFLIDDFNIKHHVVKTPNLSGVDYFATIKALKYIISPYTCAQKLGGEWEWAIINNYNNKAIALGLLFGFSTKIITFDNKYSNTMQLALWHRNFTLVDTLRNHYNIPVVNIEYYIFSKTDSEAGKLFWDHQFVIDIINRNAPVNDIYPHYKITILHHVAHFPNITPKQLDFLYSLDVNFKKISAEGASALHKAVSLSNEIFAEWLIDCGVDVDSLADGGQTPLMLADAKMTKLLLRKGASVAIKCRSMTALEQAVSQRDNDKVEILREWAKPQKLL